MFIIDEVIFFTGRHHYSLKCDNYEICDRYVDWRVGLGAGVVPREGVDKSQCDRVIALLWLAIIL